MRSLSLVILLSLAAAPATLAIGPPNPGDLVNWENPHVHPLDLTPDRTTLLAVNTPDNRLEFFSIDEAGLPHWTASVPVGLDPVSVRALSDTRAWVVNHISDSISIIDIPTRRVVATIPTGDEPADVVFAGNPTRAFVSVSQLNQVRVFDVASPLDPPDIIAIQGEDPRALAVAPDGSRVHVAIFESGNNTTIIGGGSVVPQNYPPNAVSDLDGPHAGLNPPPNVDDEFSPPVITPDPPPVGLIVRKSADGRWLDDNQGDWTEKVSGLFAPTTGRRPGWRLLDHDVATIDTTTLAVSYIPSLMNIVMALDTNPINGDVYAVGTDAANEIRFEPNLNARFLSVNLAIARPGPPPTSTILDLNPHIPAVHGPVFVPLPPAERLRSLGDPRAIAILADASAALVAGMGSNNIIALDNAGARLAEPIPVGQGPTGIALNEPADAAYVLNRFDASISTIDLTSLTRIHTEHFFDPTPIEIVLGRPFLYDTHLTSGTGHVSCASCHVDARTDRLAWDLGVPDAQTKPFNQNCLFGDCDDWHPMKGPMLTQTLQDIIGKEGLHWRADREGIEAFNPAFASILGDDELLTEQQMQAFEDFLATIHFPPNPFRNLDNSLPTDLPLPGHLATGRFAPALTPLPNGNAQRGLDNFLNGKLDALVDCATCHTVPTGAGPTAALLGPLEQPIPPGPLGEAHVGVLADAGSSNTAMKIPHLRNLYERTGFNTLIPTNTAGFGFTHDGSVDSIERFLARDAFALDNINELADMVALMLSFSGSGLPRNQPATRIEPIAPFSLDTHAAVGAQITLTAPPARRNETLDTLLDLADAGRIGLVARTPTRGYAYIANDTFQSDRAIQTTTTAELLAAAAHANETTFTAVPRNSQLRIGIDRDRDTFLDADETDLGSDPADLDSTPTLAPCPADLDADHDTDVLDFNAFAAAFGARDIPFAHPADLDHDRDVDALDFNILAANIGCAAP